MLDVSTKFNMSSSSFSLSKPVSDKSKVFLVHAMKAYGRVEA